MGSKIGEYILEFKREFSPMQRYASFDYCYNYFHDTNDLAKDIEKSCLHLAFYLSSWGMLRGSSFMLQKSCKYLQSSIEYIASLPKTYWNIDVDTYDYNSINIILEIYEQLKNKIIKLGNRDVTLISKILLGVFGFIPAYDEYFCSAFRKMANGKNGNPRCGFRSVTKKSLLVIKQFYDENKDVIDKISDDTFTISFYNGSNTNLHYPKAKVIDMFGFVYGKYV
jgi:hypothetical protein